MAKKLDTPPPDAYNHKAEAILSWLVQIEKQITEENRAIVKLGLMGELTELELEGVQSMSDLYLLLQKKFGSYEQALKVFVYALKQLGRNRRGVQCVEMLKQHEIAKPNFQLSQYTRSFQFFQCLAKICVKLDSPLAHRLITFNALMLGEHYRNIPTLENLFRKLYQHQMITEEDQEFLIQGLVLISADSCIEVITNYRCKNNLPEYEMDKAKVISDSREEVQKRHRALSGDSSESQGSDGVSVGSLPSPVALRKLTHERTPSASSESAAVATTTGQDLADETTPLLKGVERSRRADVTVGGGNTNEPLVVGLSPPRVSAPHLPNGHEATRPPAIATTTAADLAAVPGPTDLENPPHVVAEPPEHNPDGDEGHIVPSRFGVKAKMALTGLVVLLILLCALAIALISITVQSSAENFKTTQMLYENSTVEVAELKHFYTKEVQATQDIDYVEDTEHIIDYYLVPSECEHLNTSREEVSFSGTKMEDAQYVHYLLPGSSITFNVCAVTEHSIDSPVKIDMLLFNNLSKARDYNSNPYKRDFIKIYHFSVGDLAMNCEDKKYPVSEASYYITKFVLPKQPVEVQFESKIDKVSIDLDNTDLTNNCSTEANGEHCSFQLPGILHRSCLIANISRILPELSPYVHNDVERKAKIKDPSHWMPVVGVGLLFIVGFIIGGIFFVVCKLRR